MCPCGESLPDTRTICGRCEAQLRHHLDDQEGHRRELVTALTRQVQMNAPNDGSRGSSPGLLWRRMGDRFLEEIQPAEVKRLLATLPPARAAADALHAQRALLVRWSKLLIELGHGHPEWSTVRSLAQHVRLHLPHLHAHPDAPQLVMDMRALVRQVMKAIDTPPNRLRIKVGPCPEDIGTDPCLGTVVAVVPHDDPPMMTCPQCKKEWDATQWTRVGSRILARA